jgi:hypothetical protein
MLAHIGRTESEEGVGVWYRPPHTPEPPPWQIATPARGDDRWTTFGSLADSARMTSDKTESDGLAVPFVLPRDARASCCRR